MSETVRYYANVWEDGVFPVVLEADPNGDYRDDSCVQLSPDMVDRYVSAAAEFAAINNEILTRMGDDYMARLWGDLRVVYRDS